MTTAYEKPLPQINDVNRPYWEAARQGKVVLQQCVDCGHYRYPAGLVCPSCLSDKLRWQQVSGRGRVFTWTVFHQVYHPAFARDVPYPVVAIELEEGPRMISSLKDCALEDIRIGMPVEVVFEVVSPQVSLPKFRPVK